MSQLTWFEIIVNVLFSAIIVLIGYVVGRGTKKFLSYLISRIGADEWFKRFALGRAIIRSGYAPSEFFGMITSWIIYICAFFLAAIHISRQLNMWYVYDLFNSLLGYLISFVKAFIIIIVGYILVDSFIGYIYKSSELNRESGLITMAPAAEYLRVILYIVVLIFSLEQGNIPVQTLWVLITPVVWGLTIIMVVISISEILRRVLKR